MSPFQACVIDKKTRRNCQYCRFQKCLSIGMKATWVLTEEDKFEKKEKAIIKKIMTKAKKSSKMGGGSTAPIDLPEPIRTTELEGKVTQLLGGSGTNTKSSDPNLSSQVQPSPSVLSPASGAEESPGTLTAARATDHNQLVSVYFLSRNRFFS